jgi:hypothetical protein
MVALTSCRLQEKSSALGQKRMDLVIESKAFKNRIDTSEESMRFQMVEEQSFCHAARVWRRSFQNESRLRLYQPVAAHFAGPILRQSSHSSFSDGLGLSL